MKLEGVLHNEFSEHRAHGEWFRPDPSILAYIELHKTTERDRINMLRLALGD